MSHGHHHHHRIPAPQSKRPAKPPKDDHVLKPILAILLFCLIVTLVQSCQGHDMSERAASVTVQIH